MAYNTKPVVTDKDGNPISQYYNPTTNQYEPVEGSGGGNKVVLYNEDGTENNELSLIPILDKLSRLTGTVIDEETRKSNELLRIAFYEQLQQMLADGDLKGDKGDIGIGLEFDWQGNSLGVRLQGEVDYIYVDLKGDKGDKGETGNIDNLNAQHIEDALGYMPADEDIVGMLANLTTIEKANLVAAINEVKLQSNEIATDILNKAIVESGKNGNGTYVKFGDGTMVCYFYEKKTGLNVLANERDSFTKPYPSNFISRPICVGSINYLDDGSNALELTLSVVGNPPAGSSVSYICTGRHNGTTEWGATGKSATQRITDIVAIGRWKA